MNKKSIHVLVGTVLILAFSLMVGTQNLEGKEPSLQRQLMFDSTAPPPQISVEEPGYLFFIEFDLYSLDGEFMGKAVGRVFDVAPARGRSEGRELRSDFTFDLPDGRIDASVTIRELLLRLGGKGPDVLHIAEGTITGGDNNYAGAQGEVHGAGATNITPDGLQMNLRFVLNLR